MIIRMSKVEILGQKQNAEQVLDLLRNSGLLHLCSQARRLSGTKTFELSSLADNPAVLKQQIYFQESLEAINEVLKLIPDKAGRISYLNTSSLLSSVLATKDDHLKFLQSLENERNNLLSTLESLEHHVELLETLQPVLGDKFCNHHLAMIAVKLNKSGVLNNLRKLLTKSFNSDFELLSAPLPNKALAVAIIVPREQLPGLEELLDTADIPEHQKSSGETFHTLIEYLGQLALKKDSINKSLNANEEKRLQFSNRWGPYYSSCRDWLLERLECHENQADILETDRCFVIEGWIPQDDVPKLKTKLDERFHGEVTLAELQIQSHDLDEVPIVISNPAYFRPFEIFTRLLPLPRYTSFDPTPFLGLFFPVFFGMILGDTGYAIILLAIGVTGWLTLSKRPFLQDACRVLTICSIYTGVFGLAYGEFFGEQGAHLVGLKPLVIDRSRTLIPMLLFTLAVGAFHILFGLILGALEAFMQKHLREGVFRFLSLLMVSACIVLGLSYVYPASADLRTPLLITIGITTPVLIITGGFLAPLEMLKHIGHIVSYTRIMAVGMTSVMLAYIANKLAGEVGSVAAGVAVAFLLHLFNLILGVFAPTVHSLRLHYVEFFSKFYESGGRKYTPIKKN